MLWLWLATRNRFKWATGPVDQYFAFLCAQCGITTSAMVRAMGHGTGSNQMAAERSAYASANAFAYAASTAASCPHCNALQPSIHEGFARAAKKAARNRSLRVPLAAGAAFVMALLIGIAAIADLHHSTTLAVVATSVATAVGALVFAIFGGAVKTPNTNPAGVWFSRDPSQGPGSWFPAQPGQHVPFVAQPERMLRILALVTMGISAIAAITAGGLYSQTFRKVYIVSSEGAGKNLTVRIDGGPVRTVAQNSTDDAPSMMVEVRTDASHTIVAQGADGRETSYTLDPATAKYGWVLAPHARAHGLCLESITWYYGTKPKDNGDSLLEQRGDLIVLPHSFDNVFTQPPATVQTQNGSSETRTSLRALDCSALQREEDVPFKDGHRRSP